MSTTQHQDTPATVSSSATPTTRLQRAGGIASLVEGGTYVVGFAAMAAYLAPRGFADAQGDPSTALGFLLENQVAMYVWYLLLYLVAGVALVVLSMAVHDRTRDASPALAPVTTAFGLIWSGLLLASGMVSLVGQRAVVELAADDRAAATTTWAALSTVQDALGGGIEVVGAVWILLVGVAGLATRVFSRGLSWLAVSLGLVGLCTVVPQATGAASVFGIGFIVWFVWAGRVLFRR